MSENLLGEWDDEPAADAASLEAPDLGTGHAGKEDDGLEFYISSSECAALITERLGKKTSAGTFRQMVMDGEAPGPAGRDGKTIKWAQSDIDAWLAGLLPAAKSEWDTDTEAAVGGDDFDGRDFYLTAAEACALATETLGRQLTVAAFRRMVTREEAPAPVVHAGETAKWSQLTLDEWLEGQPAAASPGEPQMPEPELFYPDLASFVEDQLAPTYRRNMNGTSTTWCPTWWRHAEAISRLEALWRAWEFLRLDPSTGMSVWWRDHADHHMGVLLSADGPFTGCSPKDGHKDKLQPLKCEAPPRGLF